MRPSRDAMIRSASTLAPGVSFLALWHLIVSGNTRLEFLFASPLLVAQVALSELTGSTIWLDIETTASEAILGLFVGSILGFSSMDE